MGKFSDGMPEMGGGWFKFVEGNNRLRIVSDGAVMAEHFKQGGGGGICYGKDKGCLGCKENLQLTYRKLFVIINRKKTKDTEGNEREVGLQLAKFGNTIIKQLDALADNEDYSFDAFPMPYDITINAVGAGDKAVKYSTVPSPKRSDLTEEEKVSLEKQHSPTEIVASMKKKQMAKEGNTPSGQPEAGVDYPREDISPDESIFGDEAR